MKLWCRRKRRRSTVLISSTSFGSSVERHQVATSSGQQFVSPKASSLLFAPTKRSVAADSSSTAAEIVEKVCARLEIKDPFGFSLLIRAGQRLAFDSYVFIIAIASTMTILRTLLLFPSLPIPKDVPDDYCMFRTSILGKVFCQNQISPDEQEKTMLKIKPITFK